jgi:hypothetical protein
MAAYTTFSLSQSRTETVMVMRVEFYKGAEGRLCGWIATPSHRRAFQGSTMAAGRDLPHDLTQFTIERALDIRDGFWGLLAHGASFASVPGRRPTCPGRALVRAHHAALMAVEGIVNGHYIAWRRGGATSVRPALDARYARWLALREGDRLVLEWPVHELPGTPSQSRRSHAARHGRHLRRGAA